jgi:NOL1/NOP2/sun family putative RNA methylase
MASVGDVKRRLSSDFIEGLYEQFSPGTADKMLLAMAGERRTTLRVNTLKYTIRELMEYLNREGIKYERVSWYSDALVLRNANEKDIESLNIYDEGYVYLQSLSSMVPPLVLDPKPGERVLDVTAAPGSKTTQMAAMMDNDGSILANELDPIRTERLKFNVEKQGANIVEVIQGRGEKLHENYEGQFDKVLLDAPCSGEGRFLINDKRTYSSWSLREVQRLSNLQKRLMESAVKCMKSGGVMVYSTCTLNESENEEVLYWAENSLGMKIIDANISLPSAQSAAPRPNSSVSKGIRIIPSRDMEGFFVSKLSKI